MKKNTKIFCCFPGTGKSYVAEHEEEYGLKILDADSMASGFKYKIVRGEKVTNPNFVKDYIKFIIKTYKSGKYDLILLSYHDTLLNLVDVSGMDYCIVSPYTLLIVIERCRERGESEEFIEKLMNDWAMFRHNFATAQLQDRGIWLDQDEYLSDAIIKYMDYIKRGK